MSGPGPAAGETGGRPPGRAVVVGHGHVGRLLSGLLLSGGWETVVADTAPADGDDGGPRLLRADVGDPTQELRRELGRADAVFLAVPEQAALSAVGVLASSTSPDVTLVETLSHKHRFLTEAEQRLAPRPVLSLNPLFHPSLGWTGNAITASLLRGGPRCEALLELIGSTGARVERLGHREHDRYVTSVQALTHAALLSFAAALSRLGLDPGTVAACAPPPTRTLLALAARVLTSDVETYWDIQAAGEEAADARNALGAALGALDDCARPGGGAGAPGENGESGESGAPGDGENGENGEKQFRDLFADISGWYGDGLRGSADDAARMLTALIARPAAAGAAGAAAPAAEAPARPHRTPESHHSPAPHDSSGSP
ncbi:prephenate dehydrogenase/arogenate dehydrogenase family protein [Streptomyces sp. NPDC014894]|uniref:prephenate dehydrogenase/arogenate dehydrogenase family protein n=1 Tax=Streptomyces sp. NPDC014894 TaxID=3364931 RepID=UPI0036FDB6B5